MKRHIKEAEISTTTRLSTIALAIAAAALTISSVTVHAKGSGVVVRDHRTGTVVRDHRSPRNNEVVKSKKGHSKRGSVIIRDHRTGKIVKVRDHRTSSKVRDHRRPRKNEVVKSKRGYPKGNKVLPPPGKYSCFNGIKKLNWQGYRVLSSNCKTHVYAFRAIKTSKLYDVLMSPYTGKLTVNFIGFAH